MSERAADDQAGERRVWIVEDEPAAATLAVELCESSGAEPTVYRSPLPFLTALRETAAPAAIVLDWRLEHELSAAIFLAIRHRHAQMPIIYWTGSPARSLPSMIRDDPRVRVVDKADGTMAFDRAIAWALDAVDGERSA